MNTPTQQSAKDGFTLIEVMVSIFILTISLAGSYNLMNWMVRTNGFCNRITLATTTAQDKVDDLVEERFSNITSGTDTVSIFERTWTVSTEGARKHIQVAVRWQNLNDSQREVVVRTMVEE